MLITLITARSRESIRSDRDDDVDLTSRFAIVTFRWALALTYCAQCDNARGDDETARRQEDGGGEGIGRRRTEACGFPSRFFFPFPRISRKSRFAILSRRTATARVGIFSAIPGGETLRAPAAEIQLLDLSIRNSRTLPENPRSRSRGRTRALKDTSCARSRTCSLSMTKPPLFLSLSLQERRRFMNSLWVSTFALAEDLPFIIIYYFRFGHRVE